MQTKINLANKILCKEKDTKKNMGDKSLILQYFPKKNVNMKKFGIWNFLIKLPHKTTIKLGENIQNRKFFDLLLIYPQKQLEFSFLFSYNFFAKILNFSLILCKDWKVQRIGYCNMYRKGRSLILMYHGIWVLGFKEHII